MCVNFGIEVCLTSSQSINGTERLADGSKRLGLKDSQLIIDVQGDEPLVDPNFVDDVINFHQKNSYDCTVPHIHISEFANQNRVKLISSDDRVLYMTRADAPVCFGESQKPLKKHLSVIAFDVGCLSVCRNKTGTSGASGASRTFATSRGRFICGHF